MGLIETEEIKITVKLNDYEELVRESERVEQAIHYIDRCKYSPSKNELLSILIGKNVEEEKDE